MDDANGNDRKDARLVELGRGARPFLVARGELASQPRLARSAWILAVASGVLQSLIYPLPALSFLAWLALAPVFVAIVRGQKVAGEDFAPVSARQGFLLGYVGGVIWSFGTTYWIYHVMHSYGGLDGPTSLGVLILFCLALGVMWGVFGLLLAILAKGLLRQKALLLAPFLWVPLEIVRGFPFDFPWDPLGTVVVNNIPLTRIATATGVYGLSFEIVLVNTAFAAAFLVDAKRRRMVLLATICVAGLLQAGELVQPARLPADRTARLVQANIPILNGEQWTSQYFQSTLRELNELSVPRPGELGPTELSPDLIVWPESPAPFFINNPEFRAAVSEVARRTHATLVVGSLGLPNGTQSASQLYNSAAVIAPSGDWIARYDKIHLVPFGEYVPFKRLLSFAGKLTREVGDFIPGTSRQPLALGDYRMGVFICYEAVYPAEIREFAKNGAQVFVNISDDAWFGQTGAPVQHLNQARMRAIENNRWLVRATDTGITVAIDPYGRVVAQAARNVRTSIDVPYSVVRGTTFYTRHGNWFVWLCAIISLIALLATLPFVRHLLFEGWHFNR
ncbi:MAG TPA: apolipoprotein N-acyltransferase [Terriglobales bacterium]|nr:apolipoprotein N-acyltransferase [Terriglobales bacterium]